jgi:sugar phosphate permease
MTEKENIAAFLTNSKGLAKNPLGIIALFISLIYGFACLVLGISGTSLKENERLILIIFLVVFPIIILVSFVFLVTRHYMHRRILRMKEIILKLLILLNKVQRSRISLMIQKLHQKLRLKL